MKCLLLLTVVTLIGGISSQLIAGGKTDLSTSAPAVQSAAKFAFDSRYANSNFYWLYLLGRVTKAQSQVVDGVKYYLTFEVYGTSCRSNTAVASNCTVTGTEVCEAEVWSRPWLANGGTQLLSLNCQSA